MSNSKPKAIFGNLTGGTTLILFFGLFLFFRSGKLKKNYFKVSGEVEKIECFYAAEKKSKKGKHRYLKLKNNPEIFRLFIGKDFGDFSPKFEIIDSLQTGEKIDVFFAKSTLLQRKTSISSLNTSVQFIDKKNKPYFIRGNKDKYGSYFFISMAFILFPLLFYLKKTGKII